MLDSNFKKIDFEQILKTGRVVEYSYQFFILLDGALNRRRKVQDKTERT